MEQKKRYQWMNSMVVLFTIGWFILDNDIKGIDWKSISGFAICSMMVTVLLVHSIKAFRLYFVLYGKKISFAEHMKQYCKVIPVSMVLPFKLGEFFRIYCYGYQMGSIFDGITAILVDRFMDTLGLVTMILFMNIENHSDFPFIFYFLFIFLMITILCYLIFSEMYVYWKRELLKAKVSRRKNNALYLLEKLYYAYFELSKLIKGRCGILYLLSLTAWGMEIGGLLICNRFLQHNGSISFISKYLISALLGTESIMLKQFVLISIFLLFLLYLVVYSIEALKEKRKTDVKNIRNI